MSRGLPFTSLFYTTNSAQDTPAPLPSPLPPAATTIPPPAWMWPSCKHPRTRSFRSPSAAAKTIASLFLDSAESSSSANSSTRTMHHVDCVSDSLSTEADDVCPAAAAADDMADAIVRGLRSDRLLFEPRAPTSSILEKKPPPSPAARRGSSAGQAAEDAVSFFGGGVAVTFESADPYRDFRESMEEMVVAAHGAGGWDWLEKMLAWYLGANGKDTHSDIITAFIDLVVCMAVADDSGGASSSSHVSSFTLAGSEPAESSSAGGHFSCSRR